MSTTDVSALVREFDNARAVKAEARNRRISSAHRRETTARAASSAVRWAVAAGAVAVVLSVVVAFVL